MKKVLITGINGFVGHHLVEKLLKDYFLIGFTHKGTLKKTQNLKLHPVNILDKLAVTAVLEKYQPDAIIHLAGIASFLQDSAENVFNVNFLGTYNIYEAVLKLKLNPKILFVSSSEIYGKTSNPESIKETDLLNPVNSYAVSKLAADRLSYQLSQAQKMNIIIIRPFNHTGPGQMKGFFVPDMVSQIVEIENSQYKNDIMVGNLDSVRDISDVRDIVEGYKLALETDLPKGEAYNLCSGIGIKMRDILEKLLEKSKKKIEVKVDPGRLRPSEIPVTIGNHQKFSDATLWQPKIPIDQTLQDTLEYWRNKPENG